MITDHLVAAVSFYHLTDMVIKESSFWSALVIVSTMDRTMYRENTGIHTHPTYNVFYPYGQVCSKLFGLVCIDCISAQKSH